VAPASRADGATRSPAAVGRTWRAWRRDTRSDVGFSTRAPSWSSDARTVARATRCLRAERSVPPRRHRRARAEVVESRLSDPEWGSRVKVARGPPDTYESLSDRHVLPNLGGTQLRQLRPAILDRYLAELQRDGLSPASVKRSRGCCRASSSRRWSGNASPRTRCALHTSRRPAAGSWSVPSLQPMSSSSGGTSSPTAGCATRRSCPCSPIRDYDRARLSR
jgi:hypothetical protein